MIGRLLTKKNLIQNPWLTKRDAHQNKEKPHLHRIFNELSWIERPVGDGKVVGSTRLSIVGLPENP